MTSRAAFEAWAQPILGDNQTWRESGDCELAWQAWQAAEAHTRTAIIDLVFAQLGKTEDAAKVVAAIRASAAP